MGKQMDFPVEDVMKNVRAFVNSVKRITGNAKQHEERQSGTKKDSKPGESSTILQLRFDQSPPQSHYDYKNNPQLNSGTWDRAVRSIESMQVATIMHDE
jgi:hypothetical protein